MQPNKRKASSQISMDFTATKKARFASTEELSSEARTTGLDIACIKAELVPLVCQDGGWRSVNKEFRVLCFKETAKKIARQDEEEYSFLQTYSRELSLCCALGLYTEVKACFPKVPDLFDLGNYFPEMYKVVIRGLLNTDWELKPLYNITTAAVGATIDDADLLAATHKRTGEWHRLTLEECAQYGRTKNVIYAHANGAPWGDGKALANALRCGRLDLAQTIADLGCPLVALQSQEEAFSSVDGLRYAVEKFGYVPGHLDFRICFENLLKKQLEYIVEHCLESLALKDNPEIVEEALLTLCRHKEDVQWFLDVLLKLGRNLLNAHLPLYFTFGSRDALAERTSLLSQLAEAGFIVVLGYAPKPKWFVTTSKFRWGRMTKRPNEYVNLDQPMQEVDEADSDNESVNASEDMSVDSDENSYSEV